MCFTVLSESGNLLDLSVHVNPQAPSAHVNRRVPSEAASRPVRLGHERPPQVDLTHPIQAPRIPAGAILYSLESGTRFRCFPGLARSERMNLTLCAAPHWP